MDSEMQKPSSASAAVPKSQATGTPASAARSPGDGGAPYLAGTAAGALRQRPTPAARRTSTSSSPLSPRLTPPRRAAAAECPVPLSPMLRQHMRAAEERCCSYALKLQQQAYRLRDGETDQLAQRLAGAELAQRKTEARVAEILSQLRRASDDARLRLRRTEQAETRLHDWRLQLEQATRGRLERLERDHHSLASTVQLASSTNDICWRRLNNRLRTLEALVEDHACRDRDRMAPAVSQLEKRLQDLEHSFSCVSTALPSPHITTSTAAAEPPSLDAMVKSRLQYDFEHEDLRQKVEEAIAQAEAFQAKIDAQARCVGTLQSILSSSEERMQAGRLEVQEMCARAHEVQAAAFQLVNATRVLRDVSQKMHHVSQLHHAAHREREDPGGSQKTNTADDVDLRASKPKKCVFLGDANNSETTAERFVWRGLDEQKDELKKTLGETLSSLAHDLREGNQEDFASRISFIAHVLNDKSFDNETNVPEKLRQVSSGVDAISKLVSLLFEASPDIVSERKRSLGDEIENLETIIFNKTDATQKASADLRTASQGGA